MALKTAKIGIMKMIVTAAKTDSKNKQKNLLGLESSSAVANYKSKDLFS
jgi:hypothetical protein